MAAVSHGTRRLRQGIGVVFRGPTSRFLSETRSFFSHLVSHVVTPTFTPSSLAPARIRPINAGFSLPVRHALSRPFSPPRLPKPPVVPANVTQVGLGTARAFHSGRPIFQNMVDNVPIATRALWEAEWEVKLKKKEAHKMRRMSQNKTAPKSREMLKPKQTPVVAQPQCGASELDVYFPIVPTPAVTTHLLVPLAPTPTARLPLSAHADSGNAHPLLPISDLASIHTSHRLHSLRVSTLFARLDAASVWDDPCVNVDAYAFGPRHDTQEKQCTVLRVTFTGWNASRVRSILGDREEWYSLEETHPDSHPTLFPSPVPRQDVYLNTRPESPLLESVEFDSSCASQPRLDSVCDLPPSPPIRASASAQHDLILPSLDFSSAFSDAVDNLPPPPHTVTFLRTVSELTRDAELASQSSSALTYSQGSSWASPGLNSSVGEQHWDEVAEDM